MSIGAAFIVGLGSIAAYAGVQAAKDAPASGDSGDGSVAYIALSAVTGALVLLAKAWRDSQTVAAAAAAAAAKDAAAIAAASAKENADRLVAQQRECDTRNDRTVATVDSICERFSETQINSTKVLAETVTRLQEIVREQRAAHERREERLEQALRGVETNPPRGGG